MGAFTLHTHYLHQKYLFKIFHKLHHSIHKPNVYQHIELFTYIDGLSHIVAHWVGFTMLSQYVEFTNQSTVVTDTMSMVYSRSITTRW